MADSRPDPRVVGSALALAGVGLLAAAWLRRRRAGDGGRDRQSGGRAWQCQCGQAYRVTGTDRHRIYWLAEDSADAGPVLGQECPRCGATLPAQRETAAPGTSEPAASPQ
jgi:hypothetical protein